MEPKPNHDPYEGLSDLSAKLGYSKESSFLHEPSGQKSGGSSNSHRNRNTSRKRGSNWGRRFLET